MLSLIAPHAGLGPFRFNASNCDKTRLASMGVAFLGQNYGNCSTGLCDHIALNLLKDFFPVSRFEWFRNVQLAKKLQVTIL